MQNTHKSETKDLWEAGQKEFTGKESPMNHMYLTPLNSVSEIRRGCPLLRAERMRSGERSYIRNPKSWLRGFVSIAAFLACTLTSIPIFNFQSPVGRLQSDLQAQTLIQFRDPTNPNNFTNAVTQRWDDRQANPGVNWKLAITTPPPGRHSEGVSDQAAISTVDVNMDGIPDIVINTDPTTGLIESVVVATSDFNGDLLPDNNVFVRLPRPTQIPPTPEPRQRLSATPDEVKDAVEASFDAWDDIETASINFTFGGFEDIDFAIVAGPNGVADTTADPNSDDIQVVQVGFPQPPDIPLLGGEPIVKPGPDGIFQTIPAGDDILAPIGHIGFDAKNIITFIDYATPIGLGFPPGVLAVTMPTVLEEDTLFLDDPPAGVNSTDLNNDGTPDIPEGLYRAGTLLDVDIFFDRSFVWAIPPFDALTVIPIDPNTGLPINLADLISTATHEIGHAIGIAHTPTLDATIFPFANAFLQPDSEGRSLEPHDILSASFTYRAEPAFSGELGFITGTVRRSGSGAPVLGAYVFAIDSENGDEVVGTYTNTDGSYILLVPGAGTTVADTRYSGRYVIGIEALDGDPMSPPQANELLGDAFNLDIQDGTNDDFAFADEFYDKNKRFLIDAKPIAIVRPGETVGGINFETEDTFTLGTNDFEAFNFIEGQVLGARGRKTGISRATVVLTPDPAGQDLDRDGAIDAGFTPRILRRYIKSFGPNGVAIPDDLGPVVTATIFVSKNIELDYGNLFVRIEHPDPTNQLAFILSSPSTAGTGVKLRLTPTGNGMNFFGNEAFFVGKSARGNWTLEVEDFVRSGQGFVFEWGFEISRLDEKKVSRKTDKMGRFAFRDDRATSLALVSGEYVLSVKDSSLNFPSGSVGAFNGFTGSLSFTTAGGEQPPLAGAGGAPDIRREVFFLAASNPPVISSTLRTLSDNIFTTDEDVPIVIDLTDFGTDVEDKPRKLRWTIDPAGDFIGTATAGGPLFTSVEIDKRNVLEMIPAANAFGDGAFTLTLTDTTGQTDTIDIVVRVVPIPDPPIFESAGSQGSSVVHGRSRGKGLLTFEMNEDSRLVLDLFDSLDYVTEPLGSDGVSSSVAVGDDVQLVPLGFPVLPGQRIVDPGADNILQSAPGGDDVTVSTPPVRKIIEPFGGGNGFADTQAVGDDIQIVPFGLPAAPGQMIIDPGFDGILDSAAFVDDIATTTRILTVRDPDTLRTNLTMKVVPRQPECFDILINGRLNVDGGVFPRLNRYLDIRPGDNINVDQIGEKYCQIVVSASDNDGLSFVDLPVNIDIRSVNDPPVLADPGLITTPEGTPVVVDLRGSHLPPEQQTHDVEDPIDRLRFSVSGVDPNLFEIAIDRKSDEMTIRPLKAFGRREITLNVSDRDGATTSRTITVDITPTTNVGPPQFVRRTPAGGIFDLPDATLGVAYSEFLPVGGGSQALTWGLLAGTLPSGLFLNSTTGEIFGVATAASANVFTVRVADQLADDLQVYRITVDPLSSESGFQWAELPSGAVVPPGSATRAGLISANNGDSRSPKIAALPNGNSVVVWQDNSSGNFEIYAAMFNAGSTNLPNLWSEIGTGSRSSGGISSNIGDSLDPQVVVNNQGRPVVVWQDNSSGPGGSIADFEIYAKMFDGVSWVEIDLGSASGGGLSNTAGDSTKPALGISSGGIFAGVPMVVWQEQTPGGPQIYGRQIATGFPEIAPGSASAGGISDTAGNSIDPTIAFSAFGDAFVAWSEDSNANGVAPDAEIFLKQSRPGGFAGIDGSASGEGVSINTTGDSLNPDAIVDGGNNLFMTWEDLSAGNREIYSRKLDNGAFVEAGAGSASGGGISQTGAASKNPSFGLNRNGAPTIVWEEEQAGNPEIYGVVLNGTAFASLGVNANSGGGISQTLLNSLTPSIATDATGNPVCVWSEGPLGGPFNIYAKFLPTVDAVVANGDTFFGAIDYIEDIDAVAISVAGGTTLSAQIRAVDPQGLPSPLAQEARLVGPDGVIQSVFNAQKGVIKIKKALLPNDGDYRLEIAAAFGAPPASSIGAYQIGKLKLSGPKVSRRIIGQIDPAGEVDSYSQNIAAGSRVRIMAKGGKKTGLDPILRLLDPSGAELASNDDARPGKRDALISIPNGVALTQSGAYIIVVSGFGSTTGDYKVSIKVSSGKGQRNDISEKVGK